MAVLLNGQRPGVTVAQVQQAWDRAVRRMEAVEQREELLRKQSRWLCENADDPGYGDARRRHQQRVDEWYDEMLEAYYQQCSAVQRLVSGWNEEDAWQLREIHEYAVHGAAGLHQIRSERAEGKPSWVVVCPPTNEAPF